MCRIAGAVAKRRHKVSRLMGIRHSLSTGMQKFSLLAQAGVS